MLIRTFGTGANSGMSWHYQLPMILYGIMNVTQLGLLLLKPDLHQTYRFQVRVLVMVGCRVSVEGVNGWQLDACTRHLFAAAAHQQLGLLLLRMPGLHQAQVPGVCGGGGYIWLIVGGRGAAQSACLLVLQQLGLLLLLLLKPDLHRTAYNSTA